MYKRQDLRRAISWSTDYQEMVNGILSGNGKQMRGPIPEGMWGYDATAMQYNHDETKAKAEWDKVTSKPTSLTFLYSDNDPNWEPIALATQSSLNKLGINVKLEKLANATMRDSCLLYTSTNTGGGNNMSFLIALALTVVIYLCAYFMLFIGYIVLVLKHPDLKRTFNIHGGKGVKLSLIHI